MPIAPATDFSHPSQSYADRYPLDRLLRGAGYRIVSRPAKGPTLWADKNGRVKTFVAAVSEVKGE